MLDGHIAGDTPPLNSPDPAIHKEWCPSCPLRPPAARVTMHDLAVMVCQKHDLRLEELKGDRRTRRVTIPRQEFMALASELPHTSSVMIGLFLGGRDHSTVLHGVKAHCRRVAEKGN